MNRIAIRRARAGAAALAALVLALPATAAAHVTVAPREAPAGGYAVLDVRVPNERDDAATVRVELQLPPGFASASYEPRPGWDVTVVRRRLEQPIETPHGPVSEQVQRIVWRGDGSEQGRIPPGAFRDFPISVRIPDEPGATLTFKALQTYDSGEVVRWIGAPDAELPAAQLTVTEAPAGHGHGAPDEPGDAAAADGEGASASEQSGEAAAPADARADEDGGGDGLAIAGLVAGVAGVLLGGAALTRTRRSVTDRTP